MRIQWCLQVAIVGYILLPYLTNLLPGGGTSEQLWLDQVVALIETRGCQDPEMREVLAYTARRYRRIGPFGVRVMQLPEGKDGLNHPFCPGFTIDEGVLDWSLKEGAFVVVHEAMHDVPPHFGHTHIDNQQIWDALTP